MFYYCNIALAFFGFSLALMECTIVTIVTSELSNFVGGPFRLKQALGYNQRKPFSCTESACNL